MSARRPLRSALCLALAATLVSSAAPAGGPYGCPDGGCVANPATYGYYPTQWRRWPIGEYTAPGPGDLRRIPVGPVELPPKGSEDRQPGRPGAATTVPYDESSGATPSKSPTSLDDPTNTLPDPMNRPLPLDKPDDSRHQPPRNLHDEFSPAQYSRRNPMRAVIAAAASEERLPVIVSRRPAPPSELSAEGSDGGEPSSFSVGVSAPRDAAAPSDRAADRSATVVNPFVPVADEAPNQDQDRREVGQQPDLFQATKSSRLLPVQATGTNPFGRVNPLRDSRLVDNSRVVPAANWVDGTTQQRSASGRINPLRNR